MPNVQRSTPKAFARHGGQAKHEIGDMGQLTWPV